MAQRGRTSIYKAGVPPVSRLSVVTVSGPGFPLTEVVQASERRIGLIFYPQSNQSYEVGLQANVVPPAIFLTSGQPPVELWKDRHGEIVGAAWFGHPESSFANITFLEVFEAGDYVDSPMPAQPEPSV